MGRISMLEIEIKNLLGCDHLSLVLDPENPVNIFQLAPEIENMNTPVITAIELICTTKYSTVSSLENLSNLGTGYVRAIFQIPQSFLPDGSGDQDVNIIDITFDSDDDSPCTSREALAREERRRIRQSLKEKQFVKIEAIRRFNDSTDKIFYTVNNSAMPMIASVQQFYDRFFESAEYVIPSLKQLQGFCSGNWINLLKIVGDTKIYSGDGSPFDLLTKIFMEKPLGSNDFLFKLTAEFLKANAMVKTLRRSCLLNIFNHVRKIFEFITCLEYTIYFFVPCQNCYMNVQDITVDDFDFTDVRTKITLMADDPTDHYFWNKANNSIQDLVYIAFQLTMAFNCNQPIIIMQNLHGLRDYQCMQMASAAYLNKSMVDTTLDWTFHNYMQRIVDVSMQLNVLVFIEYPGGFPVEPKCANIVKCEYINDKWMIRLRSDAKNNGNKTNPADIIDEELQNMN